MLVSEVVNSKAIALAAEHDASNDIPYLGERWFPSDKKEGLDLEWFKTYDGLPMSLKASNFDAIPEIRALEGLDKESTEMAFFREGIQIREKDRYEIARIKETSDQYLKAALKNVYKHSSGLVRGAEVVAERMRMQLLATVNGHPTIVLNSGGVQYAYDYDPNGTYAASHYAKLSGTSMWSDTANSKPLNDLNTARKTLKKKGHVAKYALMTSNTFQYLLENAQVRNSILAQNLVASIEMTDEEVIRIVERRTKLTIVLYDKMYKDNDEVERYFYPDDKVTLLPEDALGKTWFGVTPEEMDARQVADVDVTMYGKASGIAITYKHTYGPPLKDEIFVSEIVLPSYENMNSTFVLEVHSA